MKKQPITFGGHLRRIRESASITPEELGSRSGVHAQIIRKLETGQSKFPRLDTAKKLAAALGVSLDSLAEPA